MDIFSEEEDLNAVPEGPDDSDFGPMPDLTHVTRAG